MPYVTPVMIEPVQVVGRGLLDVQGLLYQMLNRPTGSESESTALAYNLWVIRDVL